MKLTLKPEEERVVTPGPEAVRDLEELATNSDYITVLGVEVWFPKVPSPNEQFDQLQISRSPLVFPNGEQSGSLREARDIAHARGDFIPSAPLLLAIIRKIGISELFESSHGPYHEVLEGIFDAMIDGLMTDTRIHENGKAITHYPYHGQGGIPRTHCVGVLPPETNTRLYANNVFSDPALGFYTQRVLGKCSPQQLKDTLQCPDVLIDMQHLSKYGSSHIVLRRVGSGMPALIQLNASAGTPCCAYTIKRP